MSVDRVSSNSQAQYYLSRISQAGLALDKSQQQVASGKVADDYAGFGTKTAALESARAASLRNDAYAQSTNMALSQSDLQDTHLTALSDLASQLQSAITNAVGKGDPSTLMTQAKSIFEQASQILNAKDSNGKYLYGGDKDNAPPFAPATLADLVSLPSVNDAFVNGTQKKSVMVADGESVDVGILASDMGAKLMGALKTLAAYDSGGGNFSASSTITPAQDTFLSGLLPTAQAAYSDLNTTTAANGYAYNRLKDATSQQGAMSTLYTGFVSDIENVDMAQALTNLNQNQIALQAALHVTSSLNSLSLLNYMQP